MSIGQDVFRTDVGWPCVIPSGTVHSGRRWSQNKIKSACRAAHTSSTALELHRSPTVPRRLRLLYNPFTIVQCLPSNNKKHHLQRSPICSEMTDSPKPSESGIFSIKLFHPIGCLLVVEPKTRHHQVGRSSTFSRSLAGRSKRSVWCRWRSLEAEAGRERAHRHSPWQ